MSKLSPAMQDYLRQLIEKRADIEGDSPFPPFDVSICDGCSGGVRQIAQHCCALH